MNIEDFKVGQKVKLKPVELCYTSPYNIQSEMINLFDNVQVVSQVFKSTIKIDGSGWYYHSSWFDPIIDKVRLKQPIRPIRLKEGQTHRVERRTKRC